MAFTRPKIGQLLTSNTNISDPLIKLNSNQTSSNTADIGIVFERGSDSNIAIIWDESMDQLAIVNTNEDGSTTGDISITSYADIKANAFHGDGSNLTGISSSISLSENNIWLGSQRSTITTDNDGSFDMNTGQVFKCTPVSNIILTFTNPTEGQYGIIRLCNSSGHTITLGSDIEADSTASGTISTAGIYAISYFCHDGVNTLITYSNSLV